MAGVRAVDDYRWSSHRAYLGHRQPVAWLDTDRALGWFPDRDAFHRFVADDRIGAALHSSADPAAVLENVEFLLRGVGTGASRVCAGDVQPTPSLSPSHLGSDPR